jgi:Ran GTPase-activating protein (RanGAP) involved in mRNA processing and transport
MCESFFEKVIYFYIVLRLILNSLNLFDSSVSSVCRLIESNNNIHLLVLENNGFTHHGIKLFNIIGMFKICESLSRNHGVEELVMSGNPIGNEGLYLFNFIIKNCIIRLSFN